MARPGRAIIRDYSIIALAQLCMDVLSEDDDSLFHPIFDRLTVQLLKMGNRRQGNYPEVNDLYFGLIGLKFDRNRHLKFVYSRESVDTRLGGPMP